MIVAKERTELPIVIALVYAADAEIPISIDANVTNVSASHLWLDVHGETVRFRLDTGVQVRTKGCRSFKPLSRSDIEGALWIWRHRAERGASASE